jgi:hypothetical protein
MSIASRIRDNRKRNPDTQLQQDDCSLGPTMDSRVEVSDRSVKQKLEL